MKKRLLSLLLVCVLTAGNVMPVYAAPDALSGVETQTDDNEDMGGEGIDMPSPSVVVDEDTEVSSDAEEVSETDDASVEEESTVSEIDLVGSESDRDSSTGNNADDLQIIELISEGTALVLRDDSDDLPDSDELLSGFLNEQLEKQIAINEENSDKDDRSTDQNTLSSPASMAAVPRSQGMNLQGNDLIMYEYLRERIEEIASGELSSSKIEIPWTVFGVEKTEFTAEDLGVSAIVVNGKISQAACDALYALADADVSSVKDALLADCPYELYWFDKTQGINYGKPGCGARGNSTSGYILYPTSEYAWTITMYVSKEYSVGHNTGSSSVDAAIVSGINNTVSNAQTIVDTAAEQCSTDYEKLCHYRDWICEKVSYNNAAAQSSYSGGYGNPWQVIYVFDNNPNTNVVCEGYSKAFKWLCDLTSFDDDLIGCHLVNGTMSGGTGGGRHMWNHVRMDDDKYYMVDVTNYDSGNGQRPHLFLGGYASHPNANSYYYGPSNDSLQYVYGAEALSMYSVELNLSSTAYEPHPITKYDVTFNANGHGTAPAGVKVIENHKLHAPEEPSAEGYTFGGWYKEAGCNNAWDFANDVVTENITLYAKWIINSYNVTFDSCGGSGVDTISVNHGSYITKPDDPERTGYTFAGWYKDSEYSSAWTFTTDKVTKAVTLYASWTPIEYTITLNPKGGSVQNPTVKIEYDSEYGTLETPVRTGYRFDGWFISESGDSPVTAATKMVTASDHTLYAKWTINKYAVSFDPQGGSDVPSADIEYDSLVTKPSDPSRTGYTFGGWYKEAGCSNAWDFDTDKIVSVTVLYAKWIPIPYTVTFDSQGGSEISSVSVDYDTLVTMPEDPVWAGHSFDGWYKEPACTNKWNFASDKVRGTLTLYAKWVEIEKHRVSFVTDCNTVIDPVYAYHNTTITAPDNELTKTGYRFDGWFKDNGFDDADRWTFASDRVMDATILYAHWIPNTYKLTLNANGGKIGDSGTKDVDVTYDAKYVLENPVYPGYSFEGWYTDTEWTTKVTSETKVTATADHTLYARWSPGSFTVTFDENGGRDLAFSDKTKTVTYNTAYGELPVITRKGYTFAGWFTETVDGSAVSGTDVFTRTEDTTLYAHWNINKPAAIIIDPVGDVYVGQSIQLTAKVTEPENAYTDIRWSIDDQYKDIVSISADGILEAAKTGDVKVTATAYDDKGQIVKDADEHPVACVLDINVKEYVVKETELRIFDSNKTPAIYGSSSPEVFATKTLYGDDNGQVLEWKTAELKVGEKIRFKADFLPKALVNGKYVDAVEDREVIWHSENAAIASVAADGTVTAKSGGKTEITLRNRDDSLVATCTVHVYDPVTSVTLDRTTAALGHGNSVQLHVASLMPTTADQRVTWSSSNDDIATVDDGLVRANNKGLSGKVVITASAKGGKNAKCTVTVGKPVENITVKAKGGVTKVAAGKTLQLSAVFNDDIKTNAPANRSVIWTIREGSDLASINDKGVLSAYKEGRISVVAISSSDVDGDDKPIESEPYELAVYVPVKKTSLNVTKVTMASGASYELSVNIIPTVTDANASGCATGSTLGTDIMDKDVHWCLKNDDDEDYLTVDEETGTIYAIEAKSKAIPVIATITPYDSKPIVLTCSVTVSDKPISKIAIDKKTVTLGVGATDVLHEILTPTVPTDDGVEWESSDPNIVSVDPYTGMIEGISAGNAVITATSKGLNSKGNTVSAACKVTVTDKPLAMTVADSKGNETGSVIPPLPVKKKYALKVKLFDDEEKKIISEKQAVKYVSGNSRIAKVDTKGNVTGVSNGTTTIRIEAIYNPELYVEKTVTVYTASKKLTLDKKKANMSTIVDKADYGSSYNQYDVLTASIDSDKFNNDLPGDFGKIVWTLNDASMAELAVVDPGELSGCYTSAQKQNVLSELAYSEYEPGEAFVTDKGKSLAIKALKPGILKITATDPYSGKKAVCSITVYTHVKDVSVSVSSPKTIRIENDVINLKVKGKATLKSTVVTSEETNAKFIVNKNVCYRSSDPSVATVNKKGQIKALKSGTAIVKVTTADGGVDKLITVKVED